MSNYGPGTSDGQALIWDATKQVWKPSSASPVTGGGDFFVYGSGSDGSMHFDGTNTFAGFSKSGSVYKASRDCHATDVLIDVGVTVLMGSDTSGCFRMYGTGTLTNNGTLGAPGLAATTQQGANGLTNGTIGGSGSGGGGNFAAGNPGNGSSWTPCGAAGAGGKGNAGANNGGAGGTPTAPTSTHGGPDQVYLFHIALLNSTKSASGTFTLLSGGAGGGGAGGNNANNAPGGGSGGGVFLLAFKYIAGSGTITVRGGDGSSVGSVGYNTGTGCGGGGAGSGGLLWIITTTRNVASLNTVTAAHGTPGVHSGASNTDGGTGANGLIIYFFMNP